MATEFLANIADSALAPDNEDEPSQTLVLLLMRMTPQMMPFWITLLPRLSLLFDLTSF